MILSKLKQQGLAMKQCNIFKSLIKNLNQEPFLSSFALLDKLKIQTNLIDSKNDIGFDDRKFNPKFYDEIFTKALNENIEVLALEDSSYEGLCFVLKKYKLNSKIYHINEILYQNYKNLSIDKSFKNFNICLYGNFFTNLTQEILTSFDANIIQAPYENCGYFLKHINPEIAYKMASDILFNAYDSGCDFMIVSDIRAFDMLKAYKELRKANGRDIDLEVYTLSEALLLLCGEDWDLITAKHKIKK